MADNSLMITIEEARIIWPNFEGREGPYNEKGKKSFNVVVDPTTAEKLRADGWNIKGGEEDAEGNIEDFFLPIAVGFETLPPRIYLITNTATTKLDAETVAVLDDVDIRKADMTIRGRIWGEFPHGKGGIKAWLRTLFVTINEDPLDKKYGIWDKAAQKHDDHDED